MTRTELKGGHRLQLFTASGRRILFSMFFLALLPLLVMAGQGYHCAREALVASTRAHLRSVAESWRVVLESWLRERMRDLLVISRSSQCAELLRLSESGGLHASVCPYLDMFKEEAGAYVSMGLFGRGWQPVAGARGEGRAEIPPVDVRQRLLDQPRPVVFSRDGNSEGTLSVELATPVLGSGDEVLGYAVAVVDLEGALQPLLAKDSGLGDSSKIYIIDGDGRLLTRPGGLGPGAGGEEAVNGFQLKLVGSGETGSGMYRDWRGVEVVAGYAWLEEPRWALMAEVDRSEALSWLAVLRWRAVLVGLATVIAVVCFSAVAARRLSSPLRELAAAARRIGKGGHETRVDISESEEAREVSEAFNQMLSDLARTHRRLAKAASLAAVGELSSSIVHEMRNPLSSVKMNLQALARATASDPVHREMAEIALSQALRVERMLNELLNYGKPLELDPQRVAAARLMDESVTLIGAEAESRGVKVEVSDQSGGSVIAVDRERFLQALTNLLLNAVQAAKPGGRVELRAGISGGRLVIEVEDDGPGIPAQNLERIFHPFFTTRGEGTGLGLANAKKIVELHGGEITADNSPSGGAVLRVSLPVGEEVA